MNLPSFIITQYTIRLYLRQKWTLIDEMSNQDQLLKRRSPYLRQESSMVGFVREMEIEAPHDQN